MRSVLARVAFNRGLVDRLGLGRSSDVKRIQMSAEVMDNWMPRVLGSMMLRPGLGFLGEIYQDLACRFLSFIFSTSQTALLEFTPNIMRVWVADALVSRPSVTTVMINGTFVSDLTGWTSDDEAGATSSWVAPGYLQLVGDGVSRAIRVQPVTVAGANIGIQHALRVVIARGPVMCMVGISDGDDSYVTRTTLQTGNHSLAFTPTGNFFVRFESSLKRVTWVDSCTIEGAGVLTVPTNWGASVLSLLRKDQSGDVVFVACAGQRQQRVERRDNNSWSVVDYLSDDGPFLIENVSAITMAPGALSGNTTLTSSQNYFKAGHVGALFSQTSAGQTVSQNASAQNVFTNAIRVTGVGTARFFTITIAGTFSANITKQFSLTSATGPWSDYITNQYSAPTSESFTDLLDNQTVWWRIGVETGQYVSGTVMLSLVYPGGSLRGIGRVTSVSSPTVANIEVLVEFGNTGATSIWEEGQWSNVQGWPSALCFFEGRLFWAGKDQLQGSESDAFAGFDETEEGDSGPIQESIGSGPVDTINWVLPLTRLILGGQSAEHTCKSSALDQPLTPTNFAIKPTSTQGSSAVEAVKIDSGGIFIQRGGIRIFSLDFNLQTYDFNASHLSQIVPKIGSPGIVRIAVQRQPDTRVHFVRSDGVVVVLVFDRTEDVTCFLTVTTPGAGGLVEDVVTLPSQDGEQEDHVYYVVKRTINGATKRYLERWANEADALGDQALCYLADSYISQTFGSPQTVITGLGTLEGQQVAVWADNKDVGTAIASDGTRTYIYTVTGAQITLATAASNVVVGLPYIAQWKSAKVKDFQMPEGSSLAAKENFDHAGFMMANVYQKALQFGADFTQGNLRDLSNLAQGQPLNPDLILTDFDDDDFAWPGGWDNDSRICLQAQSPRPVTMLALAVSVNANI